MNLTLHEGTVGHDFVFFEEDGAGREVYIERAAVEDAFPYEGSRDASKLQALLETNMTAISRIAAAKFAAGGGFRPESDSPLRITLSADELTRSGETLAQD